MTRPLLDVERPRRRLPGQGLPRQAVPGAQGRLARHPARRDRGPRRASPGRARRRSVAPCSASRRSPGDDRLRRQGHQPPEPAGSAATLSQRDPGRVPGPVLVAEPVAHDRADPRRAAHRARRRRQGGRAAGCASSSTRSGCRPTRASRLPREFSGGQRQRIAIARALALDPEAHRLRRAGLGARPVDPGARARPLHRDPGAHRRRLPLHLARPRRGPAHQPPGRRDVPRRASSSPATATRSPPAPSTRTPSGCSWPRPCPNPDHQEERRASAPRPARRRRPHRRRSRMTTPPPSTQPETVQHLIPLLEKLTLEQKAALVQGADFWTTVPLPEIGLRAMTLSDGPAGVRGPRWDEREPSLNLPSGRRSPPRGTSTSPTATARPRHPKPVARVWTSSSARRSTCTARRSAAATSSASAKTRSCRAELAAAYVRGLQDNGVARRPSTTSPTTPRPTASPSTCGSTSARCASSTSRRSSAPSRRARGAS